MIDWEYVKELICNRMREVMLPKLQELHEKCFQGGLKSYAEGCIALYVLYYLDRERYYASFGEFVAALRLPPEAEPVLRKIWEGGVRVAKRKGVSRILGSWLWGAAEDIIFPPPSRT
ncbi:MAG: hypothetical protein QW680_12360 [Pyrobaculum sp.]